VSAGRVFGGAIWWMPTGL